MAARAKCSAAELGAWSDMDWRLAGLDDTKGALDGPDWCIGRAGEPRASFCGGGVGSALGGMIGDPPMYDDLLDKLGSGEKGGVGAAGREENFPLELSPGVP